jgi:hypothetical protein
MKHFFLLGLITNHELKIHFILQLLHFSLFSRSRNVELSSLMKFRHPIKSDEVINLAERGGSTTLVNTHFHSISFINSLNSTRI